jgi:hypothetical protein
VQFTEEENNALTGLRTFLAASVAGDIPESATFGAYIQKVSDANVWKVCEVYYDSGENDVNIVTIENSSGELVEGDVVSTCACITTKTLQDAFGDRLAVSSESTVSGINQIAFIEAGETPPEVATNVAVVEVVTADLGYSDYTDPSFWSTGSLVWDGTAQEYDVDEQDVGGLLVSGTWAAGLRPAYISIEFYVPVSRTASISVEDTNAVQYMGVSINDPDVDAWNTLVVDTSTITADIASLWFGQVDNEFPGYKIRRILFHDEAL